jgi:RNA polymerase sigma factor (sigma-70 family)
VQSGSYQVDETAGSNVRWRHTRRVTLTATDAFQCGRSRLTGIAFRILGTVADAEDAVQETYLRWNRLSPSERALIETPAAWLTRVASRICLDQLGSARTRREQYVGEWLPEPVPAGVSGGRFGGAAASATDPLDKVAFDESVSTALLVVLESLSPAERVAFVLHDVFAVPFTEIAEIVGRSTDACRQLATAARRHVRERRAGHVTTVVHDEVVRAFVAACASGDLAALTTLLDPAVELRSDGGGFVSAARRPVLGALNVARFLFGILEKQPEAEVEQRVTADGISLTFGYGGVVAGVVTLGIAAAPAPGHPPASGPAVASDVWIMMNPEKLTLWR